MTGLIKGALGNTQSSNYFDWCLSRLWELLIDILTSKLLEFTFNSMVINSINMSSMHLDHWIIQLMLPAFSGCNGSYNVQCTAKTKLKWDKATLFQGKKKHFWLVWFSLPWKSIVLSYMKLEIQKVHAILYLLGWEVVASTEFTRPHNIIMLILSLFDHLPLTFDRSFYHVICTSKLSSKL